ncbi:unnamed protein product [Rhizoctonia solani]|uniref:DUF6533 domain-containing protein n=1 Tax=Rhizoctonia solani TaxID=456999 RepID=A0A8H2WXN2_9AGAM|nr:unnamed protein product [Rhizoctonia solani]
MTSEVTPEQVQEIIAAAKDIFLTQQVTVAGLALMIWDHLVTLRSEIDLVWPAEFSWVKVLFLLNRYVPPVFIGIATANFTGSASWLSDKVSPIRLSEWSRANCCKTWLLSDIAVELLTIFCATFLIGMRVHILWDNRRDIFLWVSAAWMLHVAANIALVVVNSITNAESTHMDGMDTGHDLSLLYYGALGNQIAIDSKNRFHTYPRRNDP